MGGHEQISIHSDTQTRSFTVTSQDMGENKGTGVDFDEHPMTSVVYMGRGSFRMEAVALTPEPELVSNRGVVQHMSGVVTAPLHAPHGDDTKDDDSSRRGPDLRALFGSQDAVPLLAAPTGSVSLRAAPAVTLSRGTLGALGGLVLLCGIVVGTAARHLLAAPAPLATVAAPEKPTPTAAPVKIQPTIVLAATPAPTTPPPMAAPAATTPTPAPLPRAPLPPPVATTPVAPPPARATPPKRASAPAKRDPVAAAPPPEAKPVQKPWVDPWAN
jgi:hypothetical protein